MDKFVKLDRQFLHYWIDKIPFSRLIHYYKDLLSPHVMMQLSYVVLISIEKIVVYHVV